MWELTLPDMRESRDEEKPVSLQTYWLQDPSCMFPYGEEMFHEGRLTGQGSTDAVLLSRL